MITNNEKQDVDIDLAQLVQAVWKRKGRIILATLLAGGVAFVGSKMVEPKYKAEAKILIESRMASYGASQQAGTTTEPVLDELNVVSQSQILQSVDLLKTVIKTMKLDESPEFTKIETPSFISNILIGMALKAAPIPMPAEEQALNNLQSNLIVYPIDKSRVIAVEYSSIDPVLAAEVPNQILQSYLTFQSNAKSDTNIEAAKWLKPEIDKLSERVREADQKVADYRTNTDLLSVGEGSTFATRQLADISAELTRVRGERSSAEARAANVKDALDSGKAIDTFTDVVGSQIIQRLKENETNIQAQILDLSTTLLEGHPRIRSLRAQLQGVQKQITDESRKVLASLENEASIARLREAQLVQQLDVLKAESARVGDQEVGLNELQREASAQRQLLETYLARYREATSRAGAQESTPADARIISAAIVPRVAFFPKTSANVIVAALAVFLLSCVVVMLIELFTGRALKPLGPTRPNKKNDKSVTASTNNVSAAPVAPDALKVAQNDKRSHSKNNEAADLHSVRPVSKANNLAPKIDVAKDTLETKTVESTAALQAEVPETVALPSAFNKQSKTDVSPNDVTEYGNYSEFSLQAVADHLSQRSSKTVTIVVSPDGDQGSALTVLLAREIAEQNRSVMFVDMTSTAYPTGIMATQAGLPGIMDLLAGDAAFGEAIHEDKDSKVHLVPHGNAEPSSGAKAIEQLGLVISALSDAYDNVLVECGAVKIDSITRILKSLNAAVVLSVPDGNPAIIEELMTELASKGYSDVMPLTAVIADA